MVRPAKWPIGPMNGRESPHGYDSWYPVLHLMAFAIGARTLLEIGTGHYSVNLQRLPFTKIDSLETDPKWVTQADDPYSRRTVHRCASESQWIQQHPESWDLAFVDGASKDRAACLSNLLTGGKARVVLVHDFEKAASQFYGWTEQVPPGWGCVRWRADFPEVGVYYRIEDEARILNELVAFRDGCYEGGPGSPRERGFERLGKNPFKTHLVGAR